MMDDLQESLEDVIDGCTRALQRPMDDDLASLIENIKAQARHALDLAIDEALCNPSPRDEQTAPTLYEES
jgi:hypothetical protein